MLSQLRVDDFAIIDHLILRLQPGFTVVTGETGAGKSIIIDALQAALGARMGTGSVRSGADFASVEAVFDLPEDQPNPNLESTLAEYGIEYEPQLILRREISSVGRGTARINGRAVPLSVLAMIGNDLVDIHGQSDHLSVLRKDRQLDALDLFGSLLERRNVVTAALHEYQRARADLQALAAGRREAERRLDLLRFEVEEIESANLLPDEEETLPADRNRLANAERLQVLSRTAHDALSDDALEAIVATSRALSELASIDPSLRPIEERLESANYELDDIAQELRRYGDTVESDPQRLALVDDRLDLLARLKRKYGASIAEVIEFGAKARAEMEDVENFDERLADAARRVDEAEAVAGRLAEDLSNRRRKAGERLTAAMESALQGLGLKRTGFRVEVARAASENGIVLPTSGERVSYGTSGIDTAAYLVSFNPGEPLRPLEKVASGGETSRFLLALKSVLADADRTPTLVFDEVDVGIGGRHGTVVGERLRTLSESHQVLSITHLPQVAALGDQHISVLKIVQDGRTTVKVRALESADRVVEIAEMMSGTGTETARRNAEELLEAARSASPSAGDPNQH
jgi:DNA repair protein RecN (Recombination protein N)